jgi:hypothetical protein
MAHHQSPHPSRWYIGGTLSLIANWQIAPGGIGHVSIGATRNEFDFANHLANTIIGTI